MCIGNKYVYDQKYNCDNTNQVQEYSLLNISVTWTHTI